MNMRLAHLEGQTFGKSRPKREFVQKPAVDSGYRNRPTFATDENRLPQRMHAIGGQIKRSFGTVVDSVESGAVGFQPDRVNTGIRTHAAGHGLQLVVNVFLGKVYCI